MPRVILYTLCFSDFYGTQQTIISTAKQLDRDKYTPVVAAPYGKEFFDHLHNCNIETVPLPFKNLFDFATLAALKNLLKDRQVSLIHAHLGISTFLSLLAARLAGDIPVIATRHFITDRYSTISNPLVFAVYKKIYMSMNNSLRKIIFVSQAARQSVENREGTLGSKATIIPNSIDLAPYRHITLVKEEKSSFLNSFQVPQNRFIIVSLSRLSPEKDPLTLINAAEILEQKRPGRFFMLIGGDGPMRKELDERIHARNLEANIRFAGYLDEKKLLLGAADAFVMSSAIDSFGISILEAMAAGLPVIAAKGGGPLEIISDDRNGLFFSPGNAQDLAEKIIRIADDPALRHGISSAGLSRVADFEEHCIALRVQAVYDEILGAE